MTGDWFGGGGGGDGGGNAVYRKHRCFFFLYYRFLTANLLTSSKLCVCVCVFSPPMLTVAAMTFRFSGKREGFI